MKAKLENWLNLFNDENIIERSQQINLYIALCICMIGLAVNLTVFTIAQNSLAQFVSGCMLVLLLGVFWLVRQHYLQVSGIITVLIVFSGASYLVLSSNHGLHDVSMYAYLIVAVLSGLLFGIKGIVLSTALILAVVWAIFLGQTQEWYIGDPTLSMVTITDVIRTSILWTIISSIFSITIRNLNKTIDQVRAQQASIIDSNLALKEVQASLEEMVQQRTQKTKDAQQEAELARQQMAKQVWLMQGQAELATVMRGEQPIKQLAQGIMTKICQYLQLPTGALFVMKEGELNFAGGYAFMPHHDAPLSFKVGEGLVGEAARKRTPLVLEAQAEQPWPVVFGTTVHQVQQIVLFPFLYEEAVMGVIELGSWEAITEEQMLYLQRNMESIGIAFHSAHTRDQMNILLRSL